MGSWKRFTGPLAASAVLLAGVVLGAILAAAAPVAAAGTGLVGDPASLVNPLLGTAAFPLAETPDPGGSAPDTFPGADAPFGMLQWSPDTPSMPDGGGYDYNDSSITGFSLTHLSGPGCTAYGDVPLLPTVSPVTSQTGGNVLPDPAGQLPGLSIWARGRRPGPLLPRPRRAAIPLSGGRPTLSRRRAGSMSTPRSFSRGRSAGRP